MNTAEMISYTELLNKEKRIRKTWQHQTENFRGIYKPYSAQAQQLTALQELLGELVDPSEVFCIVKKPAECRRELRNSLLRAIELVDAEMRALKAQMPPAGGSS